MAKPVFKAYSPTQAFLIPPSFDEMIESNHPVRVVNDVIDRIDLSPLIKKYKGGGASSYHPKMLLKVVVYGYLSNIYSSRKMEAALKENIHLMWLSGMNRPDHNTLNRFRSDKLKDELKKIFVQIVQLLAAEGLLSLQEVYVDGTKIESVANRYTFVWAKNVRTNKEKIKKQLDELWEYAQQVAAEDLDGPGPPTFDKIDAEKIKETIEKIDGALKGKEVSKQVRQKLSYAKNNFPDKYGKYLEQERMLGGRNSYSKTDPDATFMRMKDDHLGNGQLKAAYNIQVSSNNQFVVDYGIHQTAADTTTYPRHMDQHKEQYGHHPEVVVADAGYGSEENLQYAEYAGMGAYLKYNTFDQEQKAGYKEKYKFIAGNFAHDKEKDRYYCPTGNPMVYIGEGKKKTSTGFEQHTLRYQAVKCEGCPLKDQCHTSAGDRIIEVNPNLNRLKEAASKKLLSEKGVYYRKKRAYDVEPVFGNIKSNHGFKRFMLKGKEKVAVEIGLLAIAQNLRKKAA